MAGIERYPRALRGVQRLRGRELNPERCVMTDGSHISGDHLERHLVGAIKDEAELVPVEEHLLVCRECVEQAEDMGAHVEAMRDALRRLRTKGKGA